MGCETLRKMSPAYIKPITPPLSQFKNRPISEAMDVFGYDYASRETPDGTAYIWHLRGQKRFIEGHGGAVLIEPECTVTLIVKEGIVRKSHHSGNACKVD